MGKLLRRYIAALLPFFALGFSASAAAAAGQRAPLHCGTLNTLLGEAGRIGLKQNIDVPQTVELHFDQGWLDKGQGKGSDFGTGSGSLRLQFRDDAIHVVVEEDIDRFTVASFVSAL